MSRERKDIREEIKKEVADALKREQLKTKKMVEEHRAILFELAEIANDLEDIKIAALKNSVGIGLNHREHLLIKKYEN
ncbi:MAG: hypothetical protein AAGC64_02795 [Bacteroidota bacterium]